MAGPLPDHLQSAVTVAKTGIFWLGIASVAILLIKFGVDRFINKKIKERRQSKEMEAREKRPRKWK